MDSLEQKLSQSAEERQQWLDTSVRKLGDEVYARVKQAGKEEMDSVAEEADLC